MLPPKAKSELTRAANTAASGDEGDLPALIEGHYEQLRALAERLMLGEAHGGSLTPTTLVHEAYMRLVDSDEVTQRGVTFFRCCFARTCRRILVDRARARRALRCGGDRKRESRCETLAVDDADQFDLLDLHEALEQLATLDPRMSRVVELRLFGGLTVPECAEVLDVSPRTIDKDWSFALTWFRRQLS